MIWLQMQTVYSFGDIINTNIDYIDLPFYGGVVTNITQ